MVQVSKRGSAQSTQSKGSDAARQSAQNIADQKITVEAKGSGSSSLPNVFESGKSDSSSGSNIRSQLPNSKSSASQITDRTTQRMFDQRPNNNLEITAATVPTSIVAEKRAKSSKKEGDLTGKTTEVEPKTTPAFLSELNDENEDTGVVASETGEIFRTDSSNVFNKNRTRRPRTQAKKSDDFFAEQRKTAEKPKHTEEELKAILASDEETPEAPEAETATAEQQQPPQDQYVPPRPTGAVAEENAKKKKKKNNRSNQSNKSKAQSRLSFWERVQDPDSRDPNQRYRNNLFRGLRPKKADNLTQEQIDRRGMDALQNRMRNNVEKYQGVYQIQENDDLGEEFKFYDYYNANEGSRDRLKNARQATKEYFVNAVFNVEGSYIDEKGFLRFGGSDGNRSDRRLEKKIFELCAYFDLDMLSVFRILICEAGISIDVDGNVMSGESLKDYKWKTEDLLDIAKSLEYKIRNSSTNNPFAFLHQNQITIGGSRRYSVPPPVELISRMMNAPNSQFVKEYGKKSPIEFHRDCLNEFNKAMKDMLTAVDGKPEQLRALRNQVLAFAEMDPYNYGGDPNAWFGDSILLERTYAEIEFDNAKELGMAPEDMQESIVAKEQRVANSKQRVIERNFITTKDENGNILKKKDRTKLDRGATTLATIQRWAGIILDPVLMGIASIEHYVGNFETKIMNHFLNSFAPKEFQVTEAYMNIQHDKEAQQELELSRRLVDAGGVDALIAFRASGKPMTEAGIREWLDEVLQIGAGETDSKILETLQRMQKTVDKWLPGNFLVGTMDMARFLESVLLLQARRHEAGQPALTTAQLVEAYNAQGGKGFIDALIDRGMGVNAIVTSSNATFNRISPITEGAKGYLRRHGLTNLAITTFICRYPDYGVKATEILLPFTNTFNYWNTKRKYESGKADLRDEVIGGESIGTDIKGGLQKAIIMDCMKIGQFGATAMFLGAVCAMLGFDEPDDPDLIYNWDAYKIGGETVKFAWWLSDLTAWGLPLAVACNVFTLTNDIDRATKVMWDGLGSMLSGSVLIQASNLITNGADFYNDLNTAMESLDAERPDDWYTQFQILTNRVGAQLFYNFTPGVINRYGRDTFVLPNSKQPNAYQVYDRSDPDNPNKTKDVTNPIEIAQRMEAQNNLFYGLFLNLTNNGYLFDDGTTDKTGYNAQWMLQEQPATTSKDPFYNTWVNKYYVDFDPVQEPGRAAELAEMIITDLQNFGTVKRAVANGYMIPYEARQIAIDYCYDQININDLDYIEASKAGEYPTFQSSFEANKRRSMMNSKYYDLISMLKDDMIPWSNISYQLKATDWTHYYRNEETGELASSMDYFWDNLPTGSHKIKKYTIPYGNTPTNFAPYTMVNRSNAGSDGNTAVGFYDENLTDPELMQQLYGDQEMPYGKFAGQSLADVTTPNGLFTDGVIPSIGMTGYEAVEETLPKALKDITLEDSATRLGLSREEIEEELAALQAGKDVGNNGWGNNYNTWRRYGGSSYGSSGPKIYSNSKVLNFDKASTMYSKTPYGATRSYLHPSFSTKGSREAYKRQDL